MIGSVVRIAGEVSYEATTGACADRGGFAGRVGPRGGGGGGGEFPVPSGRGAVGVPRWGDQDRRGRGWGEVLGRGSGRLGQLRPGRDSDGDGNAGGTGGSERRPGQDIPGFRPEALTQCGFPGGCADDRAWP